MKRISFFLMFVSFILSSCQNEDNSHDDLYNTMKSYIYGTKEDVYGFEEISRFGEKVSKLSRYTDIYLLQEELKMSVGQRLAIVAHTYFVDDKKKHFNKTLLEIDGKDLKVCPNPKYADLYLTKEEIDMANQVYYATIPEKLEYIKELESRKFNGTRYYYACKYRKKLSDRYVIKQYVVYENNKEYEICELKYDYDLLRSYVRAISSVDLKDSYVVSISNKHGWSSGDIYGHIFNRLSIDINDYTAISGY